MDSDHEATRYNAFRAALQALINGHSAENEANTPDFILAEFMHGCLTAFTVATQQRDRWYGIAPRPGWRMDPDLEGDAVRPVDRTAETDEERAARHAPLAAALRAGPIEVIRDEQRVPKPLDVGEGFGPEKVADAVIRNLKGPQGF